MEINPALNPSPPLRDLKAPSGQPGGSPVEPSRDSFASSQGAAPQSPGNVPPVDARHAMEILQEPAATMLEEIWRSRPTGNVIDVIDVGSDKIFINRWTSLEACAPRDGHPLWQKKPEGMAGLRHVVLAKNNTLVASTNQAGPEGDSIFAVGTDKGEKKWSQNARKETFFEGIAVGEDGRLFVGSSAYGGGGADDRIVALNGDTGAIEWQFKTGDRLQADPLLGPGNSVLFACKDHNLYSLDRTSGKKQWAFDSGAPIAVTPVFGPDGTVVFINTDGVITAVDAASGEKKWSGSTSGEKGFTSGTLRCGPDGTIYAVNDSTDTSLWAFDGKSGKVLWSEKTSHWVQADPLVDAEGDLYIGTRTPNSIRVYNGKTGREKGTHEVGDLVDSLSFDEKKEIIYCGTSGGRVIALRKRPPETLADRMAKEEKATPEITADEETVTIDNVKLPVNKD